MFQLLRDLPEKIVDSYKNKSLQTSINPWDPLDSINFNLIQKNSALIRSKFDFLKQNPHLISIYLFWFYLFMFIVIGFGLLVFSIVFSIHVLVFCIFIGLGPLLLFKGYMRSISTDLIKLQIAEENNWLYDPSPDYSRWRSLSSKFPEIFNKGNRSQHVEDQFWGKVNYKNKSCDFYSGLFIYTIKSSSGKNSSSKTYYTNFFSIKLKNKLGSRFNLYPESIFSKIGNFFTKKEINTESIEFNKSFAFSYNGKKDAHALNIVKTLSPAVQQKLIDLKKQKGSLEVLFVDDCVFFLFKGKMMKKFKTNFSKSLTIDSKDVSMIKDKLNQVIELSTEMGYYIN